MRPKLTASESSRWLGKLQSIHENLIAWMWALDELTALPSPQLGRLEAVRWFLGKARRDRRIILEELYALLIPTLEPARQAEVERVRMLTFETLAAGSNHVAKWTIEAIEANWTGYRDETRNVRDLWLKAIEQEKLVLYPLLHPRAVIGFAMPELAAQTGQAL